MTQLETCIQAGSRQNQLAPGEDPKIVDSQKTRGAVMHRGYDARLIGL